MSDVMDSLWRMSDIATEHGQAMYRRALSHAINMIEIDAEIGLAQLKIELAELREANQKDRESRVKAKQALLDWHNKQIEEVLDRLEQDDAKLTDGRHLELDIPSWVEAERAKLKENDDE